MPGGWAHALWTLILTQQLQRPWLAHYCFVSYGTLTEARCRKIDVKTPQKNTKARISFDCDSNHGSRLLALPFIQLTIFVSTSSAAGILRGPWLSSFGQHPRTPEVVVVLLFSARVLVLPLEGFYNSRRHDLRTSCEFEFCALCGCRGLALQLSHSCLSCFRHNHLVKMGRMHSGGKGISKSSLPYKRSPPSWLKISAQEVTEHVCKLAKKGLTPSQIGVILRDSNGIAQVRAITGSKILRVLKANGLAAEIPEDLYMLIKKAVAVRKHLERNRRDKDSKFRLILIESRIHRLSRYYRTNRKLAANWKYESASASALVA